MSAAIEQPQLKECSSCGRPKPDTEEFFRPRKERGTQLRGKCRDCMRKHDSNYKGRVRAVEIRFRMPKTRRDPSQAPYEPGPKPCVACHSMSWRVAGPRCPCCELEYAPEARPEMVLRRFDRCG